jgi:hypothetical protein
MVLTAYSTLFPAIGLFCHRRRPQCASIVADLTSASRRQNHVASPSAACAVRLRAQPRPSHPAPDVRDDREAPLLIRAGRSESLRLLPANREAKYFLQVGWTDGQIRSGQANRPRLINSGHVHFALKETRFSAPREEAVRDSNSLRRRLRSARSAAAAHCRPR